jgi:hypothetical protein
MTSIVTKRVRLLRALSSKEVFELMREIGKPTNSTAKDARAVLVMNWTPELGQKVINMLAEDLD